MKGPAFVPASRTKEIVDLAEEIAGSTPPIDPVAIIERISDLKLVQGNFKDAFDGLLEWRDGKFWIYCNLDRVGELSSPRARFTLAHELGHYFIDEHRNALRKGGAKPHPSFADFVSNELVEREADLFASHLLMPTASFRAAMSRRMSGLGEVLRLKDLFGTSITSTAIRYVTLTNAFCVVVKWHSAAYGWRWRSQEASQLQYRKTVQQLEQLPRDSATRLAWTNEGASKEIVERGAVASMWFDYVQAGGSKDDILLEQALSLGKYGVLTMLCPG